MSTIPTTVIPTTVKNKELVVRRREQIVLAAIQLFSEKGFHKTTLRELAEEAGLSYGNIYDYVGSKEDIFSLIHDYCANLTMQALRNSIERVSDPLEKLRRIIDAEFILMDQMDKAILLIYQESHILSKPYLHKLLHKEREHLRFLEEAIEESVKAGQLRECNIRFTANLIKSMIDAWVIKRWDLRGFVSRLEAERAILEFIINGLLPEPKTEAKSKNQPSHPPWEVPFGARGKSAILMNCQTPLGTAVCNSLLARGARLAAHSGPAIPTRENPVTCNWDAEGARFYSSADYGPMTAQLFHEMINELGQVDIYVHDLGLGTLELDQTQKPAQSKGLSANLMEAEEIASYLRTKQLGVLPSRILFLAPWGWDWYADSIRYETVKAGIVALTKTLAEQIAGKGVNVNCIVPGFIKTTRPSNLEKKFGDDLLERIPIHAMGQLSDVTETVLFLMGDGARYITGQVFHVSGGVN